MSDLIKRDEAICGIHYLLDYDGFKGNSGFVSKKSVIAMLEELPSAEPEPKTGKWVDMGDFEMCSVCYGTNLKRFRTIYGEAEWVKSEFCPHCGAKMEVEK